MTKEEAIGSVLEGLQNLIGMGARATVYREFSPSDDPDSDDDVIAAGKRQVAFLRDMRTRFEDALLLGQYEVRTPEALRDALLLGQYEACTPEALRKWFDTPQEALDNQTPRQMGIKAP